jgi:hypothetical protein
MKSSDLNSYIQTAAALFGIFGLFLLGYEVRQTNLLATQQAVSSNWENWIGMSESRIESGISKTIAKAMTNHDELTLAEKIDLDEYLQTFIYVYSHDYFVLRWTSRELANEILEELSDEAEQVFSGRFSRAWFEVNKSWIDPAVAEAIERGIRDTPIGFDREYYERIDSVAAALQ